MTRVVDLIESHAVVPVVSTIPDRRDGEPYAWRVSSFNDAVRGLARDRHLPLVDYWAALANAPNRGVSSDGVHPSIYRSDACVFTSEALAYGYNIRNLTALQMLARLRGY